MIDKQTIYKGTFKIADKQFLQLPNELAKEPTDYLANHLAEQIAQHLANQLANNLADLFVDQLINCSTRLESNQVNN